MTERNELILANLIANRVDTQPDLDILTFVYIDEVGEIKDEVRTYRELWDNGRRIAAALLAEGLGEGESFGLLMQNHPEFVEAMIAASITNTVFVPIDPRTRGDKLVYMLEHAECRGIICADYALPNLLAVRDRLAHLGWIYGLASRPGSVASQTDAGIKPLSAVLAAEPMAPEIRASDPDDPMQMLYTSGTTGDPKAILASHRRFGEAAALSQFIGMREGDRPYTGLSLTHANAQLVTLGNSLKAGLRAVISRKFTKSRLWDIARQYGCTLFNLLGGMTTAIYSEPRKPDDADNSVRYVLSAGMPAAIWDEFKQRFGVEIFEFYGAAEGGLTFNPPGAGPIGSVGKAPPSMELKIFDDNDNECPPNVPGEIVFRGADGTAPVVSYFKNPEASSKKTAGGWLRMGDVGYLDENGWLFFRYRKGGGIRHNGDFVNPAFVEKALAEHPQVSDVFVYGVPAASAVPGEKDVVAAVVPVDRAEFRPAAVFAHCREMLEGNFVPGYIQVVDEIPKTASEKPQERFLLEAFAAEADNVFTEPATALSMAVGE